MVYQQLIKIIGLSRLQRVIYKFFACCINVFTFNYERRNRLCLWGHYTFSQSSAELVRNATFLEEELKSLSQNLDWLEEEGENHLPGPIAFEYASFKTLMQLGSITESCWKITNLCDVIVSYLWAVCIEQGVKSLESRGNIPISRKEKEVKHAYPELKSLLDSIREIMDWRNRYGIGHGSLIRDYSVYVETLIKLTTGFLKELKKLPAFLNRHGLSLYNSKGTALVGRNYHSLLDRDNLQERFYTRNKSSGEIFADPIRLFSYYVQFWRRPHWHSLVADPSLDEVISELGGLTSAELKGLQLYLQAIKLQRNKESKKPENR